jgi:3-oxoacyl-[acyl-carrier-protein] synthase-3
MSFRAVAAGIGRYLPKKCILNVDLPDHLSTSDEWIRERTGIHQRYKAQDFETTAYMGAQAAEEALKKAGIPAESIDAMVLATTSPDHGMPATAARIQSLIGASNAFAFDVQAVCSGFVYALSIVQAFIESGQAKTILLITSEAMTRMVDWNDRTTCILFGDGAAAMVFKNVPKKETTQGILSTHLFSDGTFYDTLYIDHTVDTPDKRGAMKMSGREIFKHAVHKIGGAVTSALDAHHLTIEDIDWFIPHQANQRIINGVIEHFGLPPEKVVVTIDQHANTSAASIPLALYEAVHDERIQKGHLILVEAMGGGLTWGSGLIRW